jgi:hypothetical protein
MEPTAPIVVIDGGIGSLCQRRRSTRIASARKWLYTNPSDSMCTRNEGTEPRVPVWHSGTREAFLTLVRSAQEAIEKKGSSRSAHTRNPPSLMRVALRSRNSSENMVEASTECLTTLRVQRFLRQESFASREASRGLC